jgi:hypothetical protein
MASVVVVVVPIWIFFLFWSAKKLKIRLGFSSFVTQRETDRELILHTIVTSFA